MGDANKTEMPWPENLADTVERLDAESLSDVMGMAAILVDSTDAESLVRNFAQFFQKALTNLIEIDQVAAFEFRRGLQPKLLHFDGEGFDNNSNHYLNGMYLLDPFYNLYEIQERTGVFNIDSDTLDDLGASDYHLNYWQYLRVSHEVGNLIEIEPGRCLHFGFLFQTRDEKKVAKVVSLLTAAEPLLAVLVRKYCDNSSQDETDVARRRDLHDQVSAKLKEFGAEVLTSRERMLAQLLLKGHSTKSMARILDITPGTIGIHRSNIYRKMDVTSQAELNGLFLAKLVENKG